MPTSPLTWSLRTSLAEMAGLSWRRLRLLFLCDATAAPAEAAMLAPVQMSVRARVPRRRATARQAQRERNGGWLDDSPHWRSHGSAAVKKLCSECRKLDGAFVQRVFDRDRRRRRSWKELCEERSWRS